MAIADSSTVGLRVDQVGSLVAPKTLIDSFDGHDKGKLTAAELKLAQDAAVLAVVQKQESIGLPIITDGEFRRRNFQESFGAAVQGFEPASKSLPRADWHEPNKPLHRTEQNFDAAGPAVVTRKAAVNRLSLKHNVVLHEYRFLAPLSRRPAKVSLIGPDRIIQRFAWERSLAVYQDVDEFVADVVAIERQMISSLVEAGCRYIHIDAPGFTAYVDEVSLGRMRARGENPDRNLERAIKAENDIIAGFDGVTFGLHVCRGNPRGTDAAGNVKPQWHREGYYDSIAERLFGGLRHHRLLLEYDTERAGDFGPLRFVRKGAVAVLGIVTTKSPEVEIMEGLKRRLDDATRYLPLEQIAISPQCGFSSGVGEVQLDEEVQWRKFDVLLRTARDVWGTT